MPKALDEALRARWPRLDVLLQKALETSPLPAHPQNEGAFSEWLRALRLGSIRASGAGIV